MPIDIVADESEGAIATARITTSLGTIMAMAEVMLEERRLALRGLHVHGEDIGVNELGVFRIAAHGCEGDGGFGCRRDRH